MNESLTARCTTILPLADNDGVDLSAEVDAVLDRIVVVAGAYTSDDVRGAWAGPDGTVYKDASLRVTVAVPESKVDAVRAIVRDAKATLRQEAMFFQVERGIDTEIL